MTLLTPEAKQESDTPLTDQAVVICDAMPGWVSMVPCGIARDLERQLAAVTAERDALQESNRQESAAMALLLERAEAERVTRRWNIIEKDGELFICKGDHEKGESCREEHYTLAANFERECQDGDRLAAALGVPRTEGGSLQVQRMLGVIEALRVDAERLKAFANACLKDWPHNMGLDGFDLQDLCIEHGMLVGEQRTTFCGDECNCAEYHGENCGEFICYRRAAWLKPAAVDAARGAK